MAVKLGNGKWAIKEDKLLAYNDNSGRFFNKEFDFSRGSSATYVAKDGLIKTAGLQATNLVNNGDFSELGSELVTNGDFDTDSDWNKTGTWSVESNYATASGNSTSQYIQQDFTITNSKVYKFTYEIIENTLNGNGASLSSSGGFGSVSLSNVVGYHTEYITASNQSATYALKIGVSGTATSGQITIDNISVKQVDPNDYWTLGTGWSFGDGVATCDGSQTSGTFLQQTPITFTNGNTYKVVFTCTIQAGNLDARLQGSGATVTGTSRTSSGTYTEYLVSTGNTSFRMRGNDDFIGSVSNISVQEIQTDTPRIDFSDSVKGALLLEPQSTNLIQYSEDFNAAGWNTFSADGGTVIRTSNYSISPSGEQNSTKLNFTSEYVSLFYNFTGISGDASASIYVKGVAGEVIAFGFGPDVSFGQDFTLNGQWQRLEFNATSTNTSLNITAWGSTRNATEIEVYGVQLEALPYATSYIPNHGVSGGVTRLADVCNNSGSAQDFNSEEGVLYMEGARFKNDFNYCAIMINDNSINNVVGLKFRNIENLLVATSRNNNVSTDIFYTFTDVSLYNKIALRYNSNSLTLFVNGQQVGNESNPNIPSNLTNLEFKEANENFLGKVREVQVFTEALTDEQLEKLTTI